jgi:hypothetical protein
MILIVIFIIPVYYTLLSGENCSNTIAQFEKFITKIVIVP